MALLVALRCTGNWETDNNGSGIKTVRINTEWIHIKYRANMNNLFFQFFSLEIKDLK